MPGVHSVIMTGDHWYQREYLQGFYIAVVWYPGQSTFRVHRVVEGILDPAEHEVFTYYSPATDTGQPPTLIEAVTKMANYLSEP